MAHCFSPLTLYYVLCVCVCVHICVCVSETLPPAAVHVWDGVRSWTFTCIYIGDVWEPGQMAWNVDFHSQVSTGPPPGRAQGVALRRRTRMSPLYMDTLGVVLPLPPHPCLLSLSWYNLLHLPLVAATLPAPSTHDLSAFLLLCSPPHPTSPGSHAVTAVCHCSGTEH